jgi:hypothetical protein
VRFRRPSTALNGLIFGMGLCLQKLPGAGRFPENGEILRFRADNGEDRAAFSAEQASEGWEQAVSGPEAPEFLAADPRLSDAGEAR